MKKEIKSYNNDYGHEVADCPFCDKQIHVREATKVSPDPLRDLKRHITNQSKNEALAWNLMKNGEMDTPHLDYYKEHTSHTKVVVSEKREYDNSLTLQTNH